MKKFLVLGVFICTMSLFAQTENDYTELVREVINTEKKAAITENMNFTDAESQVFWPLYNEYQGQMYKIQNTRIEIIKDFAENYENLTAEKADQLWLAAQKFDEESLKLKKAYYKKFKKILPNGKAARLMQLENKIETMIDAKLALEIPLLEVK